MRETKQQTERVSESTDDIQLPFDAKLSIVSEADDCRQSNGLVEWADLVCRPAFPAHRSFATPSDAVRCSKLLHLIATLLASSCCSSRIRKPEVKGLSIRPRAIRATLGRTHVSSHSHSFNSVESLDLIR
jgi:hypothetical protein